MTVPPSPSSSGEEVIVAVIGEGGGGVVDVLVKCLKGWKLDDVREALGIKVYGGDGGGGGGGVGREGGVREVEKAVRKGEEEGGS